MASFLASLIPAALSYAPKIARAIGGIANVSRKVGEGVNQARQIGSAVNQATGGRFANHPLAQKANEVSKKIGQISNEVAGGADKANFHFGKGVAGLQRYHSTINGMK